MSQCSLWCYDKINYERMCRYFFHAFIAAINYGVKTPNVCRRFIIILIFRLKRANSVEAIEMLLLAQFSACKLRLFLMQFNIQLRCAVKVCIHQGDDIKAI